MINLCYDVIQNDFRRRSGQVKVKKVKFSNQYIDTKTRVYCADFRQECNTCQYASFMHVGFLTWSRTPISCTVNKSSSVLAFLTILSSKHAISLQKFMFAQFLPFAGSGHFGIFEVLQKLDEGEGKRGALLLDLSVSKLGSLLLFVTQNLVVQFFFLHLTRGRSMPIILG